MDTFRKIKQIIHGQPTSDGAGVRPTRIFGFLRRRPAGPVFIAGFFRIRQPEVHLQAGTGALFNQGPQIKAVSGNKGARFILICGKPIREPIAWRGPVVMNTEEELSVAFREYREGTFIK